MLGAAAAVVAPAAAPVVAAAAAAAVVTANVQTAVVREREESESAKASTVQYVAKKKLYHSKSWLGFLLKFTNFSNMEILQITVRPKRRFLFFSKDIFTYIFLPNQKFFSKKTLKSVILFQRKRGVFIHHEPGPRHLPATFPPCPPRRCP